MFVLSQTVQELTSLENQALSLGCLFGFRLCKAQAGCLDFGWFILG
jgi:hypothetical protein